MTDPTQPVEQPTQPTAATPPADQPAPPVESTPAPAAPDPQDEIAKLQAQLEEAKAEQQAAAQQAEADKQAAVEAALAQRSGQDTGKGVTADMSELSQADRRKRYADWPVEGGSDELPQPWDLRALGLQNAARDFTDQAKPGSRNTVSPIVIHHGRPMLTYGSSDPAVQDLGRILGELGFDNSVSDGQNPFGSVDNTVMAAVFAFRDAYGVQEDPSGFGGNTPDGRAQAAAHIGPWTWEAILRAGARLDDEAAA